RLGHAVACALVTCVGGWTGTVVAAMLGRQHQSVVVGNSAWSETWVPTEVLLAGATIGLVLGALTAGGLSLVPLPPQTSRRRFPLAVAAIAALIVCALGSYVGFLWAGPEGAIEVVFEDEDVLVALAGKGDNGDLVEKTILPGQGPLRLPPGEYRLTA